MNRTIFRLYAAALIVLILSGCGLNKTPDPIQSLSKATPNTERLVAFEATKEVWIRYNVGVGQNGSMNEEAPIINASAIADDGSIPIEPTAAIGLLPGNASNPGFYTLQPGETPKCIARRYNLDWIKLYSINGISFENEALIGAGKNLILPQNSEWLSDRYGERATAPHPAQHSVVAGETLYSIACIYGDVSPEAIAIQNGLNSADQVAPGMTLTIP